MSDTGVDVLVSHPSFGSLWLTNARIKGDSVVGEAVADTIFGRDITETMNFPRTCVRKWSTGHAPDCAVHQLESCDCEGGDR